MRNVVMSVETADLRKSAEFINDKTARYEAEYAKIYSEIANLRISWQGLSSDTFNKQIEGYRNDFDELARVLKSYAEFLKTTAEKIERTENAIKDAAGNLSIGH